MKIDGLTGEPRRVFRLARRLRLIRYAVILATIGGLIFAAPAAFGGACLMKRDDMGDALKRVDEAPVAIGLGADGQVTEVFVSEAREWSIVVTHPSGLSCVVASGEAWEQIPIAMAVESEQAL